MYAVHVSDFAVGRAMALGKKGVGNAVVLIAVVFAVVGVVAGVAVIGASFNNRNPQYGVPVGLGIIIGAVVQAVFIGAAGVAVEHLRSIAISNVQACELNAQSVKLLSEAVGYQQGG